MENESHIRKRLRLRVAIRLLGICIFGCLTGFLVFDSPYWMAGIWTSIITIGLFIETIRFVTQSELKLTAFLQALRQNDFAITFSESKDSDNYDLHRAFNQLNDIFKKLRSERESQHQLLQAIVENSSAPLICFEETTGEIFLINHAAKNLFQVPFLQKIESLGRIDAGLTRTLIEMPDGGRITEKLVVAGKTSILSIHAQHLLFENRNLKLISIHDVSSEMAAREAETWQKLLRVLTHEISNSAIPLSTLSSYIYEMVTEANAKDRRLTEEERSDMMESLRTIDQRSKSLKEFVHNFRNINQVPEPCLEKVEMLALVNESLSLYMKELQKENITLSIKIPAQQFVYADRCLTQQVLINLIKNAVEAMRNMKDEKHIELAASFVGNRYRQLHVRDTGQGISQEDLDQIFIPFFSTKKGGSGIGLSISKQIMQKQNGDISVQSIPGRGSVFTLSFTS
ncbi:MAG: GHKL domain-containing protein [Cyclobacteriaceae bacterium]|nr:GHKL domain-containing protein [Cyclobacteriaceae bacterium]UYN87060.1 MAG: GHKL domain-containing protein [Cyclobacteriaceae bacterium]